MLNGVRGRRQPLEGAPVHPLGFRAWAVETARLPAQLVADSICPPCHPVVIRIPLAGIGQLVTVTTSEDAATVEDCHPLAAPVGGTPEPGPFPVKMGGGPIEIDGVAFVLPVFAATPVAVVDQTPLRFFVEIMWEIRISLRGHWAA